MVLFIRFLPLLLLFSGCPWWALSGVLANNIIQHDVDSLRCNTTSPRSWGGCLPWAFCAADGNCSCKTDFKNSVICGMGKTLVETCSCLTYSEADSEYNLGACLYSCTISTSIFYYEIASDRRQLTNETCSPWGRSGTLCGDCLPGHSLPAYSYQMSCIQCPHSRSNKWKLALIVSVSITVFYIVIIIWRVRITAPDMYGFIFYAQLCSCPIFLRQLAMARFSLSDTYFHSAIKILSPFYTIWNLDMVKPFTENFCLDLDPQLTLSLEYVVALYPLLLVFATGFLAKICESKAMRKYVCKLLPSSVCNHIGSSWPQESRPLMDAYVAFFVLSLTKFFYVSFDLLIPSSIDSLQPNGSIKRFYTLYFSGTVKYFGPAHRPYAILAISMVTIFVICPTTLLFLYPFLWFHRLVLNKLPLKVQLALHHFVDKFQGFYKDGTNGTRDYRYFSVLHITLLFILFAMYSTLGVHKFLFVSSIILILAGFLYTFCQPYKEPYVSCSKMSSLLLLTSGIQYSLISFVSQVSRKWLVNVTDVICILLALMPLAWKTYSVARAMYLKAKQFRKLSQKGHQMEKPLNDDLKVLYGAV